MTSIGFMGLGAMGSRLAGRLFDAGHTVYTGQTAPSPRPNR
jgi:3-hydroxyisobutyrate dehydrogenase-like beta-hydroxyacid dehydrogenase